LRPYASILVLLFILVVSLAGCAIQKKITWDKPGATEESFRRDVYECTQETRVSGTAAGSLVFVAAANANSQKQANALFVMCMQARGYRESSESLPAPALQPADDSYGRAHTSDYINYDGALKTSEKENKPLLLYFFSKTSDYCAMMDKTTLSEEDVAAMLRKDFVFLRVDVDQSKDIAKLYPIKGTPSSWFIESSGKRVGEVPGYIRPEEYKKILGYVKAKYYTKVDLRTFLDISGDKR